MDSIYEWYINGEQVIAIRKKPARIFTLAEYETRGIISQAHADAIRGAMMQKENILIVECSSH